jgi:hypothetical protein
VDLLRHCQSGSCRYLDSNLCSAELLPPERFLPPAPTASRETCWYSRESSVHPFDFITLGHRANSFSFSWLAIRTADLMLRTSLRSVRALGSQPAAAAVGRQLVARRAGVSGAVSTICQLTCRTSQSVVGKEYEANSFIITALLRR